eukprot:s60_g8.t1
MRITPENQVVIAISLGLLLASRSFVQCYVSFASTPRSRLRRGFSACAAGGPGRPWEPGPAKVESLPGQKARQLLLENPMLFEDSLDSELEALSYEPEEQVDKDNQPEAGDEGLDAAASLRKRIEEVRASERGRALSDLLYLMVCDGFRRVGYQLARPLQAGGRADLGGRAEEETLTTKLHSEEVLAAVEEHMAQSMPGGMAAASSSVLQQMVQLPFFNIGQAYALTVQYGYVLKRAESRLQLERGLQPDGGVKSLSSYIKGIGPGIFQDTSRAAAQSGNVSYCEQIEAFSEEARSERLQAEAERLTSLQKRGKGHEVAVASGSLRSLGFGLVSGKAAAEAAELILSLIGVGASRQSVERKSLSLVESALRDGLGLRATAASEERRKRVFGTNVINLGAKVLRLEHEDVDANEDDIADAEVKDFDFSCDICEMRTELDELLCRSSSFSQHLRPESEGHDAIDLEET